MPIQDSFSAIKIILVCLRNRISNYDSGSSGSRFNNVLITRKSISSTQKNTYTTKKHLSLFAIRTTPFTVKSEKHEYAFHHIYDEETKQVLLIEIMKEKNIAYFISTNLFKTFFPLVCKFVVTWSQQIS